MSDIENVKKLREATGAGFKDCNLAIKESGGDIDKAIEILRVKGISKASKKMSRDAKEGVVAVSGNENKTSVIEVNCETDFAARDDNFVAFVKTVTERVLEAGETNVEALGLETERENLVQKIGENISIRRAELFKDEGTVVEYLHTNGRIGVMLSMEGGSEDLGKDVAMHIAAMNPTVVSSEDAPADLVAKEREIYAAQAQDSGKPPEIVEKMIDGRIRKYLAEISLLEQVFVKDGDTKIGALLKKEGAAVNRFVRYEVGEGIEKEEEDFAAEVQKQLGN